MTERLSQMLNSEADGLDVPPPAADAVLRRGRSLRRRRVTTAAAGAVLVCASVGGVVALTAGDDGMSDGTDAAASTSEGAVFAVEDTLYYADGTKTATIDDKAVKSLYYTSAGVLVRQGNNPFSDGGGPQRFSVLASDGSVTKVSLETEGTVHATDPDQPYLAYGQEVDGELVLFVRDVETDEEVARIPVTQTKQGWFPLSMDGDRVYLQNGDGGTTYVVNWRTGDLSESDVVEHGLSVAGGHAVVARGRGGSAVVDVDSGEPLVELPGEGWTQFSPDGRFVTFESFRMSEEPAGAVFDVETGSHIKVVGDPGWGWTADGALFSVSTDGTLTTCDPTTGDCSESQVDLPQAPNLDVILGGTIGES